MSGGKDGRPDPTRWIVHGERLVDDTRRLRLSIAQVELPDGVRFEQYVLRMPKAAMTVLLDDAGERVLMIWRHRFVPDCWAWELPGGYVDPDEDPVVAAAREVEEETGWRPRSMSPLTRFQPLAGTADFGLPRKADQEMLAANIVVAKPLRLLVSQRNDLTCRLSEPLEHGGLPPRLKAPTAGILLMHRLLGDPESLGYSWPGPAIRPGIFHLQRFQDVQQTPQRRHGGQTRLGVLVSSRRSQLSHLAGSNFPHGGQRSLTIRYSQPTLTAWEAERIRQPQYTTGITTPRDHHIAAPLRMPTG